MFFVSTLYTHKDRVVLDILISIPYISMQDPIKKITNTIPWIFSRLRFYAQGFPLFIYTTYIEL